MKHRVHDLLTLILLATLLSACGQKGPLYLPDSTPSAPKTHE